MTKCTFTFVLITLQISSAIGICGQPNVYPDIKTFGPECNYRCNCAYNAQCDYATGECPHGCLRGWMGPACQYRDLAAAAVLTENGLNSKSGEEPYYPGLATDGNISTCSRISPALGRHSLMVSLKVQFFIGGMVIKTKQTNTNFFRGFTIDVGNSTTGHFTLCYAHGDKNGDAVMDVNCAKPLVAQFIRLNLDEQEMNEVSVCEVELYGGRLVSFNKPSLMVSTYGLWSSLYAVDGRIHTSDMNQRITSTRTCASTDPTYINVSDHWWSVDLGRTFTLLGLSLFSRQDTGSDNSSLIRQYNNFVVECSNDNISFEEIFRDSPPSNDPLDYNPKSYNLTWPINFRFVKVDRNPYSILSVCEFEVFAECPDGLCGWECTDSCMCNSQIAGTNKILGTCPHGCIGRWTGPDGKCDIECKDYRWGPFCNNSCENCLYPCNVANGICAGSCRPGWMLPDCTKACPAGKYGTNCELTCGRCKENEGCNRFTGQCDVGCQPGYKPPFCVNGCDSGKYGDNCVNICGNCLYGDICDFISGACPRGCVTGYQEDKCKSVCPEGMYGLNCKYSCGACNVVSKNSCDKETGECSNGCLVGWTGRFCNESCRKGFFGQACLLQCGHCKDGHTCNPQSGHCRLCEAGFTGESCTAICADGRYGEGCQFSCGHCANGEPCNRTTGVCPQGCSSGFAGYLCKDDTETDTFSGLIAGITVVGILFCISTGLHLLIFCKRRFSRQIRKKTDEISCVRATGTDNDMYDIVLSSCKSSSTELGGYDNLRVGVDST